MVSNFDAESPILGAVVMVIGLSVAAALCIYNYGARAPSIRADEAITDPLVGDIAGREVPMTDLPRAMEAGAPLPRHI
jgi:hypothetical protein